MKVLWKKKIPRENPSYLFSSKKPNLRVGPKKISWRPQEEPGRCQAPAETDAECGRLRDLLGVSGTFWVSRMRTNSEPRRSSHLLLKPSYAAAVALNCQTRDSASRLRPRRLTSLPSVIQRSRLPGNDSGLRARRRCGERTQRVFFKGGRLMGQRSSHMQMTRAAEHETHTVTHQTHAIWFDCQVLKDHYSHLATHRIRR